METQCSPLLQAGAISSTQTSAPPPQPRVNPSTPPPPRVGTVWIVIPTYNEGENLARLIPMLEAQCLGTPIHILVVDDMSADATESVVSGLLARYDNITLYRRPGKRGLGSALREGLTLALADRECTHICTLDADFSHDPEELPVLLSAAERAAFVQGSRYIKGGRILNWPWRRRMLSWGINRICQLLGGRLHEHTTNYRLYDRRAATEAIKARAAGGFEWVILASLAIQASGLPMVEVPITFREREIGTSKLGSLALMRYGPFVASLLIAMFASQLARLATLPPHRAVRPSPEPVGPESNGPGTRVQFPAPGPASQGSPTRAGP